MVPNGWEWTKLGKLANKVGSGVTPKGGSNSYKSSGIPLIRSQNVLWGTLDLKDVAFIDDSQHEKMKGSVVCKGDVLLNITGASIGRAAVSNLDEANVNQHVCIIRSDKLDPEFLRDFLLSFNGQKQIEQFQAGGNRQGLNFEQIKSFKLPLPPLSEQRKIAKILSTWDNAISTTERLIDNSKQQKKALMQQLLTGKKRLLDDSGKPFEGEWDEKRLSEFGNIYSGGTPSTAKPEYWDGNINWVTPTDITKQDSIYIESTARLVSMVGIKNSSAKLLPKGTLLVCTRATIGEMAIARHEMSTNQGFKNIVPNENTNIEFVYYLLNFYKHKLISKASGSTFLELSKSAFEGLHFYVPEYQEQKKIAAVLLNADREIDALQQQLADLKQEKKALMQQLLTGKKRVLI